MKWKIFILSVFFLFSLSILPALDYTIPPNTYSIQSGDFDNDSDNDIVVGHINQNIYQSLIENIGNSEFEIVEQLTSDETRFFYLFSTLDENLFADFIIQNEYLDLIVFYDSEFSNPYFYDIQAQHGLKNINFVDFDCDGDYDLVFSSYGAGQDNLWGVMYNLCDREFSDPEWFECPNQAGNAGFYKIACHDLDANGQDDVIAYTNEETYLYYSINDLFVLDSLNCYAPNGGMVSEDFDNDEDYDIIITHWSGGTQSHFLIYENIGEGEFTLHDVIYDNLWGQPISADINGDGFEDIVNVGNINGIGIFYNIGNMQFDEAVYDPVVSYGENYFRASFSDFDDNGTQDVAIIRYGIEENNLTILYNDGNGNFGEEPVSADNNQLPMTNYQLTNFPNPFNPETTISYELPVNIENPVIEIFNVKGKKVKSLCAFPNGSLGTRSVVWDGTDNYQSQVSSGVYLYRVKSDDFVSKTKRMLLLK